MSKHAARRDRGSSTVELVLVAPLFFVLLALVVAAGRVGAHRADLEAVAHSSARSLSLARDPNAASPRVEREAAEALQEGGPGCRHVRWEATVTATEVTVTIACDVDLAATALAPIPGVITVVGQSTEAIDRFREQP